MSQVKTALKNGGGRMHPIRVYREKRGLTQAELAFILEVSRTAVVKWETGVANPKVDNLVKLAKVLRCSVDDLLGVRGRKKVSKKC